MKRRPNYLLLGVLGSFLVLLAGYFIFTKRIPLVHGHRVDITFQSSNQLITGSPVRIAGIDVGKVVKITPGPNHTQVVRVDLKDSGLPLHEDARARIRPRLFLEGGFMVEINPGSPSAPEIPDGGRIPLSQTATPVQFHQILGMFNRPTRESLRIFFDELARALDEGGAEALGAASKPLAPLLRDAAWITEAARGSRPHDLSDTVRSTSKITGALAERRADLADLVTNLRITTGAMAAEEANLSATVRELDTLLADAPAALTSLDAALPPVRRFASAVRPGLRAAPAALDQLSGLLTQLYGLTSARELPRTIALLEPTADELPSLLRRLTALFPLVTPVTDCVRDRAAPVLEAKLDDGPLSTNRPVWQDLLHALVGLNAASQDYDANGPWIRYLAGAGEQVVTLGPLQGAATEPVLGARPQWLGKGVTSPYRPDARCIDQAPVDLKARTGPPARSRRAGRSTIRRLPASKLRKLVASLPAATAGRAGR